MQANIVAIKQLIKDKYRNNKTWFSEEIGVSRSYLQCVLSGRKNASSYKFCDRILIYCKKNNLDHERYIFLP